MTGVATRPDSTSSTFSSDEVCWAAVVTRSHNADDRFYYAVITTGVYCRPSCAARLARRENVRFYSTRDEAERAGFRACKRCRPNTPALTEQHTATVAKACRLIEEADELPSLDALSRTSK